MNPVVTHHFRLSICRVAMASVAMLLSAAGEEEGMPNVPASPLNLVELLSRSDVVFSGTVVNSGSLEGGLMTEVDMVQVTRVFAVHKSVPRKLSPNQAGQFFVFQIAGGPVFGRNLSYIPLLWEEEHIFFCTLHPVPADQIVKWGPSQKNTTKVSSTPTLKLVEWQTFVPREDHYDQAVQPLTPLSDFLESWKRFNGAESLEEMREFLTDRYYGRLKLAYGAPDGNLLVQELDAVLPALTAQTEEERRERLRSLQASDKPRLRIFADGMLALPETPCFVIGPPPPAP